MGIHLDNPAGNFPLDSLSRGLSKTGRIHDKDSVEPESFMALLKKVSNSPEQPVIHPGQVLFPLSAQKALALCRKMELQMNESLLRIVSDTQEENQFETSLMAGLKDILSQGKKEEAELSMIRQTPSENRLPGIQPPKSPDEKTGNTPGEHEIDRIIQQASATHGVDPELIRGVIRAESDFNPDAVSPKGAMGLMQLMPGTARELGVSDPMNPTQNIMGGTQYLKKLLDRYDGSVPLALAAYNWGMGNLDSRRSPMPAETRNYVAKITGMTIS